VVIQDADGLHTIPVEIVPAAASEAAAASEDLRVLVSEPFEVRESASVPPAGSVSINYDSSFLLLETAGIENPTMHDDLEIAWTFKGIQAGRTTITIITRGGIATFVAMRTIEVEIVVLAK